MDVEGRLRVSAHGAIVATPPALGNEVASPCHPVASRCHHAAEYRGPHLTIVRTGATVEP